MRICSLLLICLFCFFLPAGLLGQNLFPQKIDIASPADYCMDCGNPKATISDFSLDYISTMLNHKYRFNGGFFSISFQVLVDSVGFSCVVSHSDVTTSPITWDLIRYLNGSLWTPAVVNGKRVNSSVNVVFVISGGKMFGQMKRMDLSQLQPPTDPVIYNTQYNYTNPSLKGYDFTVWTKYNSPLPDNVGKDCVVDKSDILWYATASGFVRFDGKTFNPVNETNSPFTSTTEVHAIAVDKDDNKWMYADKSIYMYKNSGWLLFDSTSFKITGAYRIIAPPTGEVFFTNKKGLLIVRNDKLRLMDKKALLDLPSNDVRYAYYDSRHRLWIGTAGGSVVMNKQRANIFNRSNTPLNGVCITNMTEDEKGNLYFALHSFTKPDGDNEEEGIAVFTADGKWLHYNDKNSGMPSNKVNCLLYDKIEHVLWIGTENSGLVRFDLKDGWETYNNTNSKAPGHEINQLAEDSKGVIYVATANGMLQIKKK